MSARLALPDDPSVDALPEGIRRAIAAHWLHRASSELAVAHAFEALLPRLASVGAARPVLALAAKAIDDEQRHAGLCLDLATRYLGATTMMPDAAFPGLPSFGTNDERLEVALLVLGSSCINESIASVWIRASWHTATSPLAVFANRHHLADEVDHARLGWAHFASSAVDAELRARVRPFVARSVAVNVAQWRRPDEALPEEGVPEHGHLARTEHLAVVDDAMASVVRPGLVAVGLATG